MGDPSGFDSIWELVRWRASATPDHVIAVDIAGRTITAAGLRDRAEVVAASLALRGIGHGSVVAWQLPTRIDSIVLTTALCRLGALQVPLVPILRRREVEFICRQAGACLLVVPAVFRGFEHGVMAAGIAGAVEGLEVMVLDGALPPEQGDSVTLLDAPPPAGDECRWFFYTSGTTAAPKGAMHRDRHLIAASVGMTANLAITEHDRYSALAPITHIGGIVQIITALRTGCRLLLVETFEVAAVVEFLRRQGATLVGLGTAMFTAYLAHQREHPELRPMFPAIRSFTSGGAPTPPALHYDLRREIGGLGITSGWGLTECPMSTWNTMDDSDELLATTEGRAVPGLEVIAVTIDGRRAGVGEEGELRLKGPMLMIGYVDRSLDADAFDAEGWFRTGDLGTIDADGYVRITGRLKDIIIRNAENISALELEGLIYTHPAVREVAVIGVPDPITGEKACAVVVAEATAKPTLASINDHLLAAGLSNRKLPEQLLVVDALPRNAMGKVLKNDLRAMVAP